MPFDGLAYLPSPDTKPDAGEAWRQVLRDAADHLERYGWCNHSAHGYGVPNCAGLAIYRICREGGCEAQIILAKHLGLEPVWFGRGGYIEALFRWNDAPGRTAAEVTAALRECAGS